MNILVCIKQVPDDAVKIGLNAEGEPALNGVAQIVNTFDTYAVEMAVRFTEANGGKVTVLTLGEEALVRPAAVQMIAVGAANGYIGRYSGGDEAHVAQALAAAVNEVETREGPYDLILCGKEASDRISSAVGALLSQKLNRGFLSNVVDLQLEGETLKAYQETDEGKNVFAVQPGSVLTVGKPAYDPRYPNLKSKMAARKAVIPVLEAEDEAETLVLHEAYKAPAVRAKGVRIEEKEAADAVAKALALLDERKVL